MTESPSPDADVPWIDDGPRPAEQLVAAAELEVIPDAESNTVTFASTRAADADTTTAWLTADADLVVDVAEMH